MKIAKEEEKKKMNSVGLNGGRIEEEEGKTVVVGVKMDPESRELLTWALVKAARPGDRVVALHVLPTSTEVSDPDKKCSTLLSLVKAFDSVLAVYDGFCNLKQIDLKLKLCRGSSIRKVLVREAKSLAATKLILGITKNCRAIGPSPTSIAKYCAEKVARDCSVLVVNNGKIIFQKETTEKNNSSNPHNGGVNSPSWLSINGQADALRSSLYGLSAASKGKLNCTSTNCDANRVSASPDASKHQNCSICSPIYSPLSSPEQGRKEKRPSKSKKDEFLALVPVKKAESPSISVSLFIRELPEARPGWPLLRRAVFNDKKKSASQKKSKISVVQWAMQLPSRYSAASAVHPNRRHTKFDRESRAMVPVGAESFHSSVAVHDEEKEIPEELKSLQEKYSSVCRLFSYKELMKATSNFCPDNLIGKGGSSHVYKGCLSDGKELAVKILKPSEDAIKEFVSEIEIITSLHHKNIISLLGFCFENKNLILVYDFLSRGSLEEDLHGEKENKNALSWVERYKIAVGVAEALDYLHGGVGAQPVIHRDVKSSNILLSDDFKPQLSDFGLAKWASASASHMKCSDVAGTFGYLAPEYFMYGKVNEKIDVYAFGVVLLELLSGRKPVSTGCSKGEESLVMLAKPILLDGKVTQLVDPCLGDKYDNDQMERMTIAASLCIRRTSRSRPHIDLVMKLLQGDGDVLKWAKSQVGLSEELDGLDGEAADPHSNIQSHINLALLDIEDDTLSISSADPSFDFITANTSLEDYLRGRWSRSSSFD